jgi:hypothetical protein
MKLMVIALALVLSACPKKTPTTPEDPEPADAGADVVTPADAPPAPPVNPFCANRPEKAGPFILDATLAGQRVGTGAKTYADVDPTKEKPVEVCGLEGARLWLENTKCPDGSAGTQQGRVGSIGLGGRCNTMLEKFKVGCPDGSINVLIAVHFCGPGEAM